MAVTEFMNREKLRNIFSQMVSRNELSAGFFTVIRKFIESNTQALTEETGFNCEPFVKEGIHDEHKVSCASIPFLNKRTFKLFKAFLPKEVNEVMKELIYDPVLHQDEILKKFKTTIWFMDKGGDTSYYTIGTPAVKPMFHIFKIIDHNKEASTKANYSLSLSLKLRLIILHYYNEPNDSLLRPVEKPEKTEFLYRTGDRDLSIELGRMVFYGEQGEIKVTAKGRPSLGSFAKTKRSLNIKEFFPKSKDKLLKVARTALLTSMAITLRKKHLDDEFGEVIKKIFHRNYHALYDSGPSILYYIKGMAAISNQEILPVEETFITLLNRFQEGEWLSFDNVYRYLKFHSIQMEPIDKKYASKKLTHKRINRKRGYRYEETFYISEENYRTCITEPYVKGTFFLLATLGLLDIAYDTPDTEMLGSTYFSPYDNLRYLRLSSLGAYVMGKKATYELPEAGLRASIELSPDHLMIVSNGDDDEAAEAILTTFMEQVAPNRYRTDYGIFLKDCKSRAELKSKIAFFRESVGEMPNNWVQFLQELAYKIDPFESIDRMSVFRIPKQNKKLIKIVARDAILKNLVIKAEGLMILVKKENVNKFKKRMQEFGYLMT